MAHLNPVSKTSPVSFCVWRNGIQALYNVGGIAKVLDVFGEWLSDASQDNLEHDGWEPVPRVGCHLLGTNIGDFQRFVANQKNGKPGLISGTNGRGYADIETKIESVWLSIELERSINEFSLSGIVESGVNGLPSKLHNIPWLLIWGDRKLPIQEKFITQIDSYSNLQEFSKHLGVYSITSNFFEWLLNENHSFELGIFVLLFGVWRPKALIPENPSDATGQSRKVEIIPIFVEVANEDNKTVIKRVEQFSLLEKMSSGLLRKVSGKDPGIKTSKATIIGCGAVGSKVIDHLCREGSNDLILVDQDQFQPHNVTRHTLGEVYVWSRKVDALKFHLSHFFNVDVEAIPKRIQDLNKKEESKVRRCAVIIDTSADKNVTDFLCNNNELPRCVKTFIAMEGRLGIIMVEGKKHNPKLDDIEACLYLKSTENELVSTWLRSEKTGQNTVIGLSCSSVTFRIPDSLVSLHSANFMPIISKIMDRVFVEKGFGIHTASSDGQSQGWEWTAVPEFRVWRKIKDANNQTWDIRIHPTVIKEIAQVASNCKPNEAGGFLYGLYSVNQRVVTIVKTCCPIPLKATPSGLILPAAGNTQEEIGLLEASNKNIQMLGSWHSHPENSNNMSPVDINTMRDASMANNKAPRPFVMLIYNKSGISANIALPTDWL